MRVGNFTGHYVSWRKNRIDATVDFYGADYFKNKTLLEIGCGWGDVGNHFHQLGAIVTVSDAREEHIHVVKEKYPHLNSLVVDSESTEWLYNTDVFDIVIHWGVLYHLQNPENSIKLFSDHCKILVLETEVSDSENSNLLKLRDEPTDWSKGAWSQAYSGVGSLPSYAWVEDKLDKYGFDWKRIENPGRLNTSGHHYNWKRENNSKWVSGQRAFWFCEK